MSSRTPLVDYRLAMISLCGLLLLASGCGTPGQSASPQVEPASIAPPPPDEITTQPDTDVQFRQVEREMQALDKVWEQEQRRRKQAERQQRLQAEQRRQQEFDQALGQRSFGSQSIPQPQTTVQYATPPAPPPPASPPAPAAAGSGALSGYPPAHTYGGASSQAPGNPGVYRTPSGTAYTYPNRRSAPNPGYGSGAYGAGSPPEGAYGGQVRREAVQCSGWTKEDQQCRRRTTNLSGLCYQHER